MPQGTFPWNGKFPRSSILELWAKISHIDRERYVNGACSTSAAFSDSNISTRFEDHVAFLSLLWGISWWTVGWSCDLELWYFYFKTGQWVTCYIQNLHIFTLHHICSITSCLLLSLEDTSSNSVTCNHFCRAREVTPSFMDVLIALTYLLLVSSGFSTLVYLFKLRQTVHKQCIAYCAE